MPPSTTRAFAPAAFFASLLGAAFTSWSAWGNSVDVCFSAGCAVYQDAAIAGVSMWWIGAAAFALLALLALIGRPGVALFVASTALFLDCLLLLLLALTAPCVACLIAGALFALSYAAFRNASLRGRQTHPPRSRLLLVWSFLLVANLIGIARGEMGTWPMNRARDPYMNFYFSPSCSACREGLLAFSGRRNTAFYPVPKNEEDVRIIMVMNRFVEQGAGMAEALKRASEAPAPDAFELWSFNALRLRFALFRNKAHALIAGGGVLPFVEYLGLPPAAAPAGSSGKTPPAPADAAGATLPIDAAPAGVCREASCP
jgi:hypothetical protein